MSQTHKTNFVLGQFNTQHFIVEGATILHFKIQLATLQEQANRTLASTTKTQQEVR